MKHELAEDVLRVRLRCLMILGRLPVDPPARRRIAPGHGGACSACARSVDRGDLEITLHFPVLAGQSPIRLHALCEIAWNAERVAEDVLEARARVA